MNLSKTLVVVALSLCLGVANSAQAQDSFFDVFIQLMADGDIDYESTATTSYGGFDTEMVSMNLRSSTIPNVVVNPQADGSFIVDSFFDIAYSVGPVGGPYQIDSFFDVFTEIHFAPPTGTGDTRTFDTEILSMDLSSATGPNGPIVLGMADGRHRGHVTVLKAMDPGPGGGDGFQIDSFFDVFTDISVSGGPYEPADAATPLAFSAFVVPEPTSVLLLAGGLALSLLGGRRRQR